MCVSSASTASAWNWAEILSPSFTSRTTTLSAQWSRCGKPRRCRGTPGRSASRRGYGCHARVMSSCCREVCARGTARTKSVVANGIAQFLATSSDSLRSRPPPSQGEVGHRDRGAITSPYRARELRFSVLDDAHDPVVLRPDEDDRALGLVCEEAVVLDLGHVVVEQARHRIERRGTRRDLPDFCLEPDGVALSSDPEE